jgi:hypothetical protein
MGYGFRLFYFGIHARMGHTPLELDQKLNGKTCAELLDQTLDTLTADNSTRAGMPSLKNTADGGDVTPAAPAERGDVAIKFEHHDQPGPRHLSLTVRYGRVYGHDLAIAPSGDANIAGKAPSHVFRAEILLPKAGAQGLLVVEDIDRSCPGPAIGQWISKQSKWDAGDDGRWWRMRLQRLSDDERLQELIRNSKKAEIRLRRYGKSGSGKRRQTPLWITAPVEQASDLKRLANEARKWLLGDTAAKSQGVAILAEVAGDGVTELNPDEGGLYIEDGSTTKKITPDRLDEVFVYPIGDSAPMPDDWESAVLRRLSALRGTLPFDVEW